MTISKAMFDLAVLFGASLVALEQAGRGLNRITELFKATPPPSLPPQCALATELVPYLPIVPSGSCAVQPTCDLLLTCPRVLPTILSVGANVTHTTTATALTLKAPVCVAVSGASLIPAVAVTALGVYATYRLCTQRKPKVVVQQQPKKDVLKPKIAITKRSKKCVSISRTSSGE